MDRIPSLLFFSVAFSLSSALPQYSTALPRAYSTPTPLYSNPAQYQNAGQSQNSAPQYQNVGSPYSTAVPQYSTAGAQYSSPAPPQYSTSQPQYSPSQLPSDRYQTTPIPILNQNQELNPDGSYHYGYQTGNGISAEERGAIKNLGSPDNEQINSVQGYFSYPGLDGVQYSLTYTADENGFQPQAAHLPTPPPVPAELLKAYEALPPDNNEYDEKGFPIGGQAGRPFDNGRV